VNQLWVRLSLAFALVLTISFLLIVIVFRLRYPDPPGPPPPEVVAYFEENERFSANPFLVSLIVGGIAIIAGVLVSRTLASPMSDLEEAAVDIGQGDLNTRVDPRGSQEMVAVATAFNDMAAQLEQAESMRQSLLADVAHELRHPIHVLQGNLQAMQDGVYPVNDEEINRLIAQTRHLTVMVNDLHVLAQAEARQLPLHIQEIDIAGLVKEVTAVYQPLAAAREIDLHVELLGTMPPALPVDKARIRQALQNLLENSLRHTADGGQISMTVQQQDGRLIIAVIDDGEGIAPDQLPLVFDRLYQGDPSRQRFGESTGLGLAISKALVEAHGGTITAESPGVDQGSTFLITLPM
jgi:signal transduction histidine kinase